eukprot:gene13180-biopygen21542
MGETAPRPVRIYFFEPYRAAPVRSAFGPRTLPFLPVLVPVPECVPVLQCASVPCACACVRTRARVCVCVCVCSCCVRVCGRDRVGSQLPAPPRGQPRAMTGETNRRKPYPGPGRIIPQKMKINRDFDFV